MENRNGLLVDFRIAAATGTAERETALAMMDDVLPGQRRITLAADRGYDTRDFVRACRDRNVTRMSLKTPRGGARQSTRVRPPAQASS